jgi:hypothetical protein
LLMVSKDSIEGKKRANTVPFDTRAAGGWDEM